MKSLIAIALLLACSGAWADGDTVIYECPNVRQGTADYILPGLVPYVFSDCRVEVFLPATFSIDEDNSQTLQAGEIGYPGIGFLPLAGLGFGPLFIGAFTGDEITPTPSGGEMVGTALAGDDGYISVGTHDMGPDYSGNCSELEAKEWSEGTTAWGESGRVYCSVMELADNRRILARAKWVVNTDASPYVATFEDPQILVESPAPATPVPTMPMYLLMGLSGLLALFGFYRVRASK